MKNIFLIVAAGVVIVSQFACAGLARQTHPPPLIAIIDTGFDTDHPALQTRLVDRYDFSRETKDVIPYISRKDLSGDVYERLKSLIEWAPGLKKWFPLERNIEEEFKAAAFHGTAVASLALYDLRLSAALYKVYPIPQDVDPDEWMTKSVLAAIQRAVAHKARVINLSLGFTFELGAPETAKHQKLMETIRAAILANPDVLFVAAAGNENQTIDHLKIAGYPCGLPLENVICVGAIDHDGKLWKVSPAKGTNLVAIPNMTTVFSYGDSVFSAVPQKMCVTREAVRALFSQEAVTNEMAQNLLKACTDNSGYADGEATSMATPLVTHRAAEILMRRPTLRASELKAEILKSTLPSAADRGIQYVHPLRPSWARKW